MYLLNFYLLLSAVAICLFGRFLGKQIAVLANLGLLFVVAVINIFIFYEALLGSVLELQLFTWVATGDLVVNFGLFYDLLSSSMLALVTFISFLVHVYSYSYMSADPSKVRFFCYLSFFTFFMALLVVSDSLVQLFFAWEGVGVTSYLLINFWYTRYEANRAALKAVFVNRFGDFGLYTGIILFIVYFKTQSITTINSLANELKAEHFIDFSFLGCKIDLLTFIGFFLFLGVVGKSAQLGLHTWLPDAMEGPTPVSALLHAATMVTAGVYLVLRLSYFFEVSGIMSLIAFWGALTAFVSSTIGAFQNDIKKIIAYSTCSQLGYMLAACGLYNFAGAYFHLFNHAFFKALLFLGAGSIIHSLGDEQDLRKFGGLLRLLPFTHICLLLASLSLMGAPFFSGFYSKDLIMNWAYTSPTLHGRVVYFLLLMAAFFTSYYSLKVIYYSFYSTPRFSYSSLMGVRESSIWMKLPMLVLSFLALSSGYFFWEALVGYGIIMPTAVDISKNYFLLSESVPQLRKFAPAIAGGMAIILFSCVLRYYRIYFVKLLNSSLPMLGKIVLVQTFFNKKWYFDYFNFFIVRNVMALSFRILFKNFDKGLLERVFVKKTVWTVIALANVLRFKQTGNLTDYIMNLVTLTMYLLALFVLLSYGNVSLVLLFLFYGMYTVWKR